MRGDHDAVMDRYAYVLEALQAQGYRRLLVYLEEGRGQFTTWLIVVARRLCLDHHRQRYGRVQADGPAAVARRIERRQLVDLVGTELGLEAVPSPDEAADEAIDRADRRAALTRALDRLEPAERLLLRLRFGDGLSVPEIARLRGEPAPFRTYRALDRLLVQLRRWLAEDGVTGSGGDA